MTTKMVIKRDGGDNHVVVFMMIMMITMMVKLNVTDVVTALVSRCKSAVYYGYRHVHLGKMVEC